MIGSTETYTIKKKLLSLNFDYVATENCADFFTHLIYEHVRFGMLEIARYRYFFNDVGQQASY